jgi:hypothetical protein
MSTWAIATCGNPCTKAGHRHMQKTVVVAFNFYKSGGIAGGGEADRQLCKLLLGDDRLAAAIEWWRICMHCLNKSAMHGGPGMLGYPRASIC